MTPYWTCQLVGWSLHGLLTATIPTLYGGFTWEVLGRAVVGAVSGLVLTDQLRRHIRRRAWLRLPLAKLLPRIAGASAIVGVLMVLLVLPFLVRIIPPDRTGPLTAVVSGQVGVILVWSGIYLVVQYLRGLRTAEAERWRLEVARRDAELRALRAQLDPPFCSTASTVSAR